MVRGLVAAGLTLGMWAWLLPGALAAPEGPIGAAIERGVAFLQKIQTKEGNFQRSEAGATALGALTLIECGVPPDDPGVRRAVQFIRDQAIRLDHTYSLALSIMLLDRVGDPADVPLIQSMGVRLLGGQNLAGGWSYGCAGPSDEEATFLEKAVRQPNELKVGDPPKGGGNQKKPVVALPQVIQTNLEQILKRGPTSHGDDNSNTQFAVLGLWVARRHGVPVAKALALTDMRFRNSQNPDGGWGYLSGFRNAGAQDASSAAMTCAGLMAVGFNLGMINEAAGRPAAKFANDRSVRAALMAVSTAVGQPTGILRGNRPLPLPGRVPPLEKGHYFLWSLERMAVAYDLKTIGNKDWYNWGAEILVLSQKPNGSWQGEYGEDVDTCFSLLFLKRANLAKDLSATLKGGVLDPGEVTLKSGGVGGDALKGLKPGVTLRDKPGSEPTATPTPTPAANLDPEAAKLCADLVKATPAQQEKLLVQLRDTKGVVYSQALAAAIPQLSGETKNRARDALADRLTRMTANTLRDKLKDEDVEVRRAAALACAMKEDRAHIPDLIAALDDSDPMVGKAARVGLKSLTGKDFNSAVAWKAWWKTQKEK